MKRYSQHQIEALLDKFMDGQTSVEEEKALADYFRTHDVPAEWEDYRVMFSYFDRGMEGKLLSEQPTLLMSRHWWGIAAAAVITAAIVGTAVLHRPTTSTVPEVAEAVTQKPQQPSTSPIETPDLASLQTTEQSQEAPATSPVETQNLASPSVANNHASHQARRNSASSAQRRLQVENAKLARENERLQRELADLKRRSFIIDLEANGFKAVMNEDGNIVLIDLEQEIENELNNQPTTNLPSL